MKLINKIGVAFLMLSSTAVHAQEQEVEVVIATGMEMAQASAFSPDNRFVAQALYNAITLWDVKTGRMLRVVTYVDVLSSVTDTIWFSADSKTLIVGIAVSNDTYRVDVASGDVEYVKGAAFNYATYKYQLSNRQSSAQNLYIPKPKKLSYKSPNGKGSLVYKTIKNPYGNQKVVPHMYELRAKTKEGLSEPFDTVFQAGFSFSPDGSYAFAGSSIIEMSTGRLVSALKIVPYSGSSVMFLPGTRTPVTSGINSLRIWEFPDIDDIPVTSLMKFMPTPDGRIIAYGRYDFKNSVIEYGLLDVIKRKRIGKPVRSDNNGYLLDVSPDGNYYAFQEMTKPDPAKWDIVYNVRICDAAGKIVHTIKNSTRCYFTEDPNVMLVDSLGIQNMKYNLKNGSMKRFPEDPVGGWASMVSRDKKYLMGSTTLGVKDEITQSEAYIWEVSTGNKVFTAPFQGVNISGFSTSKDGKYVAFGTSYKHAVVVYEFATAEKLFTLEGHTAIIENTVFSDDGKRLITSGLDGTRRVWNLEKGTPMVSLVNVGKKDYAIITPNQYYFATKGAKKLIHFVKGVDIYPFAQFDLKYNRPDIIIQSLEASNQGLAKPFYYAYQKRLKRLGFTEEMLDGTFHMPTASIDNVDELPFSTAEGKLKIKVSAGDEKFNLDRMLIRVNEVPLRGKRGISLADKESKSYSDEIEVELSRGKNLIEVSVMNEKGVESIASNVTISYQPTTITKPNLYLYTIGVSEYEQSDFNLTYAAKDASDIHNLYGNSAIPFDKIISKQITNEQVTVEAIEAIKEDLMNTNVDDAVCVFYAGHGILDVELNYYLASYNIDFKDPAAKGIPYEVFEDLLDDIPARKKLIMIDACHSGEIDKEEVALIESENTDNTEGDISFRAVTSTSLKRVGLNNSFELMKELFTDIRKSSGTVIISSAGGMEYAMEGGEWNNGVFTYCFINGIKNKEADLNGDGKVMLSEMNGFVREKVFALTKGRQQPTNRAEVFESDWRLW